jgi:hypothetical protein
MKDARCLKIGLPELRFDSVERTSFFWWVQVLEDRSTNALCLFHADLRSSAVVDRGPLSPVSWHTRIARDQAGVTQTVTVRCAVRIRPVTPASLVEVT